MISNGSRNKGFTIVELLIVVVIVAILADITVVAYNGIRDRAYNSSVSTSLSTLKKAIELYKVEKNVYPPAGPSGFGTTPADLKGYLVPDYINGMPDLTGITDYVWSTGGTSYALRVEYKGRARCKTGVNMHPLWWSSAPEC